MRKMRNLSSIALLGLLLAGCNGESPTLDDPDDANSVLEVMTTTIPPANLSGSASDGTCVLTITNASVTLRNKAKSSPAEGQPFNDIEMQSVTIHYTWDNPAIVTPDRTWSLGATVPAEGQQSVTFPPIAFGDTNPSMQGHTVNMFMVFRGIAISGEPVTADGGGHLGVGGVCDP